MDLKKYGLQITIVVIACWLALMLDRTLYKQILAWKVKRAAAGAVGTEQPAKDDDTYQYIS